MWCKVTNSNEKEKTDLDRFRVFQSQITMVDQERNDSGLEIIPGFYKYAIEYFQITNIEKQHGFNVNIGSYNRKFLREFDSDIIDCFVPVQRIPLDWNEKDLQIPIISSDKNNLKDIVSHVHSCFKEHKKLKFNPTKEGDMVTKLKFKNKKIKK